MNDREMLEMAAKAARYAFKWGINSLLVADFSHPDSGFTSVDPGNDVFNLVEWNPLKDDGDALRLAVNLGLQFYGREIGASVDGYEFFYEADCGGDKYLAARRAIVIAAAEIGRNMRERRTDSQTW